MSMSAQNITRKEEALTILGFKKDFTLNQDAKKILNQAFRKKSLGCHPDKHPDKNDDFIRLTTAHDLLKDMIDSPRKYESFTSSMPSNQANMWQQWEDIFNRHRNSMPKKADLPVFKLSFSYTCQSRISNQETLFGASEQDFKTTCERFMSSYLGKDISELVIKPENKNLHVRTSAIFLEAILKHKNISKVTYPKDFFNATQIERLNAHLDNNKENNFYIKVGTAFSKGLEAICFARCFTSEKEFRVFVSQEVKGKYIKTKKLQIEESSLSAKAVQFIVDEILKNPDLESVQVPPGFFSKNQQAQVDEHVKKNGYFIKMDSSEYSKFPQYCTQFKVQNNDELLRNEVAKKLKVGTKLFTIEKAKLPPKGAQIVLEEILNNVTLKRVNVPDKFFNHKQQQQLDKHLEANRNRYNGKCLLDIQVGYEDNIFVHKLQSRGENIFKNDCENIIADHFRNISKIIIPNNKIKLPYNGPQILLDVIKQNNHLREVETPKGFFNKTQQKELADHLSQNKLRDAHKRAASKGAYWSLWFGLGAISYGLFYAYTFLPLVTLVFASVVAGKVFSMVRQFSLARSGSHYEQVPSIKRITNQSEKAALKAGIEAQSWGGYFLSWGKPSTYKHPVAFQGGLNLAQQENDEVIAKVKAGCR